MATDQTTVPTAQPRRRRKWLLGALVTLVVLFVLVVFVLPTPIARYVIESQLESLGIKHDGIDTIDIDLWNSRVRAGPVAFGAGEVQRAQIGEAGFDYRLGAAFEGRALITTFYLRGVNLAVTRHDDGAIIINGVNLKDIAEGKKSDDGDESSAGEASFEAGVERFEFTDSQLDFEDVTGGVLTMELQRLTLERLRTWTPKEPTAFSLEARLNEMTLALDGSVVPLSNPLRVTLNSRIEDVTVERVARFVGPTGLKKQEGRLYTEVHYAWSIHKDGRIEGTVDGTYHLKDLAIVTPAGEQAKVGEAMLKVDLRQGLAADRSATATGKLTLDASALSLSTAVGDSATLAKLAFAVDELDFSKLARERQRLIQPAVHSEPDVGALSIIELMIGWARDLGLNALKHYLEIDGKPKLKLSDAVVRTAARDGVPAQKLSVNEATISLGTLTSEAVDSGWNASAGLDAMLRGLRVTGEGGGVQAELAQLSARSSAINLSVTSGSAALGFDLAAVVKKLTAAQDGSGSLTLGALTLKSDRLSIKESADKREATGPITLKLDELVANGASTGTGTGTDDELKISGRSLQVILSPFTLSETPSLATRFAGSVQINEVAVERAGASPLSMSVASAKTEFSNAQIAPLNLSAIVEGGVNTQFTGIRVDTGQGNDKLSLSLAGIESQAERFRAFGFDSDNPAVEAAGRTTLGKLEASLPIGEGRRASASMDSLDAPLTQLALSAGVVRAAGALDVRGIALTTDEKPPQSANIAQLSIEDLQGDSEKGGEAKRVAVSELVASLRRPPATDETDKSTPFEKRIKLGEFSVSSGSRIALTDPSVKPPLKVDVVVNTLTAGPIDTNAPSTRTKLSLVATLNKTTKAALEGWASPLADKTDFDLSLNVDKLALPTLSAYAASLAGVDLESGVLKAGVKAKAKAGALDGKIDLLINDLFVVPVSEKKAKEIAASIGVPVGFAVSVLKDGNGVIKFGFPLSGTLESPQVDYSEAINKAIGGAIASLLPTGWFAKDGNSFQMQPATFVAGSTELTKAGKDVADQMSTLFKKKSGISIRACGRAARADLISLRQTPASAAPPPAEPVSPQSNAQGTQSPKIPPQQPTLAEPNESEVKALLALAIRRGEAIRQYLESAHGIGKERIPECRTAYSIEDGKDPRAEFQF